MQIQVALRFWEHSEELGLEIGRVLVSKGANVAQVARDEAELVTASRVASRGRNRAHALATTRSLELPGSRVLVVLTAW